MTNVHSLKDLVYNFLSFRSDFEEHVFMNQMYDTMYTEMKLLLENTLHAKTEEIIINTYLAKFALNDMFKAKVIKALFSKYSFRTHILPLFEEDLRQIRKIDELIEEFSKEIMSRLNIIYVCLTDDEVKCEVHYDGRRSFREDGTWWYKLSYLLLLWQLQNTGDERLRKRYDIDDGLTKLLRMIS